MKMRRFKPFICFLLVLVFVLAMGETAFAADYYGTVGEKFYACIDTSEIISECKLVSGALPPGLKCDTNGSTAYIKGTPTGAGTYGAGIHLVEMEGGRESEFLILSGAAVLIVLMICVTVLLSIKHRKR